MTRAPAYLDDNTSTFARTCPGYGQTQAEFACAVQLYRTPLHKRAILALCRWGWAIVPALLAVSVLGGCTDDLDAAVAMQADLADAIAQAAKEAGK